MLIFYIKSTNTNNNTNNNTQNNNKLTNSNSNVSNIDKSLNHKFLFEFIIISKDDITKIVKEIFEKYTKEKRKVKGFVLKKTVKLVNVNFSRNNTTFSNVSSPGGNYSVAATDQMHSIKEDSLFLSGKRKLSEMSEFKVKEEEDSKVKNHNTIISDSNESIIKLNNKLHNDIDEADNNINNNKTNTNKIDKDNQNKDDDNNDETTHNQEK